jgi:hypothetical protein
LQNGIAIGFLKAIGFRTGPYRTIFDVWCRDPTYEVVIKSPGFQTHTGRVEVTVASKVAMDTRLTLGSEARKKQNLDQAAEGVIWTLNPKFFKRWMR